MQKLKIMTIKIPFELWQKLKHMIADGKIKSIQKAVIDGLLHIIKQKD
jgi:hypothetical protein